MSEYTYKQILKKAKKVKKQVESGKKITVSTKWAYYIGKSILNPKKNIAKKSFKKASNPQGTTINKNLGVDEYKLLITKMIDFVEGSNKRLPNFMLYKNEKIKPKLYLYTLSKILIFYYTNKRLPNKVSVNYKDIKIKKAKTSVSQSSANCKNPYTSSPHYYDSGCNKLGQCTPYFCGPHSIHQILKKFGVTDISEEQLAKWAGTTSSGTDHEGLNTAIEQAARKAGIKLDVQWYYMSDFGPNTVEQFKTLGKMICKPDIGMLLHIGYQGSGSSKKGTIFGHYEDIDKIDVNEMQIRALNSLGNRCGAGYCGHLQWRDFDLQKHYINNKEGVKSVCIITKK